MEQRVNDSMFFTPCSIDEIRTIIKSFDNGKASDISIRIIKKSAPIILPYLTLFYNKFIDIGIFPDILKVGQITPIFKKGNPQLMQNYRPVSTLPCFSKIFEKIIYSRLYNFLNSKGIIYDNQYGFRSHHSTSHAVNYSINKIVSNIEQKIISLESLLILVKLLTLFAMKICIVNLKIMEYEECHFNF